MGRSLILLGEHAKPADVHIRYRKKPFQIPASRKLTILFEFPSWTLNSLIVRAFNCIHYWNGRRKPKLQLVDWNSYFYPLDMILGWNKIYGRHGFAQFQCVLPLQQTERGLHELISTIANARAGSFLAVLKRFGTQESQISFPM